MKVSARVDVEAVVQLTVAALRQLPYATNSAITRTAKEAVNAGQKELAADLQIRKRFILQRLKILQYSRVNDLTAVVGIDPRVQGSPLILGFLETGGEKVPTKGSELAIPLTGEAPRPTFPQTIKPSLAYPALQFQNRRGRQRTFIVPGVGVFQRVQSYAGRVLRGLGRTGEGLDNTVLIYAFKPAAKLPPHTHLRQAMIAVIGERFSPIFTEEFTRELLNRARR
ncbi:MAG: hypothetical protein WAN12_18865 [Candidatus Acidiferrum sp.]